MEVLLAFVIVGEVMIFVVLHFLRNEIIALRKDKPVTIATPFVVKDEMLNRNMEAIGQAPQDSNDTIGKYNPGSWT